MGQGEELGAIANVVDIRVRDAPQGSFPQSKKIVGIDNLEVDKAILHISPVESTVAAGSTVQFKAVENDKDAAVTWSIVACDDTCGTISSAGLYTAPPKIPNPSKVRIRATIILISNGTAETTVTVVEPKH